MKKQVRIFKFFLLMIVSVVLFTGCDKKITKSNSVVASFNNFSMRVFKSLDSNEESKKIDLDGFKQFTYKDKNDYVISIREYNYWLCGPKEAAEFRLSVSKEAHGITEDIFVQQETLKNFEDCYKFYMEYNEQGGSYYEEEYIVGKECMYLLIQTSGKVADHTRNAKQVKAMLDTIEYTSGRMIPTAADCPYAVENLDFKVTLDESAVCCNLKTGLEEGKNLYSLTDEELKFGVLGTKDAGTTFMVTESNLYGYSPEELVSEFEKEYKKKDGYKNVKVEVVTLGDVWPEISDSLKDVTACRLYTEQLDAIASETYLFQSEGKGVMFRFSYTPEDTETRDKLYTIVPGVEVK